MDIAETGERLTLETVKINLENLENFERQSENDIKQRNSRLALWYADDQAKRSMQRKSNRGNEKDYKNKANLVIKTISRLPRFLIGSYEISHIEDVVSRLRDLFEHRIQEIIEILSI